MTVQLDLKVPCTLLAVRKLGQVVRAVLEPDVDARVVGAVELAAVEACSNIVKHGCDTDANSVLRVGVELAPGTITVDFVDRGRPFDLSDSRHATVVDSPSGLRTHGLGLPIIHELVDEIGYEVTPEGNHTRLVKRVPTSPCMASESSADHSTRGNKTPITGAASGTTT